MSGLTTLPKNASVDEVAVFERDGGVIVADLFDWEVLESLRGPGPVIENVPSTRRVCRREASRLRRERRSDGRPVHSAGLRPLQGDRGRPGRL